ncbi:YebC/PmpR family DNA-binding transcriptional regulator [bacterium]|nr:YebC/PmpR family DNA-binding transcriptional regulator [bacterium]|tara:strand:+ start:7212 stop:7739 length:528 start_codon:yes stop_codon:yes gene_type:complete
MSGHNKWSKIKHKKAADDAKKSKVFSKFARLLTLESKKAEGNVSAPGLRSVVEQAKAVNMPSANIERAIKKGTEKEAGALEEVVYEAYGPGGSALIIVGLTDNKNRSAAETKHTLSKYGASLSAPGSAAWAFEKKESEWIPKTIIPLPQEDTDKLGKLIEELENNDDVQNVYTNT